MLNGDPKTISRQRDWGYSLGGPVGKPGGSNKLFFFFTQEFEPRTGGNNVTRFRLPTALERQGDFSRSTDNNGNPYPYVKDPRLSGACTAASQVACFDDGGVLGKIPPNMLYQTGLNILNMWPLPNIDNVPAQQAYNFELTRPNESAAELAARAPVGLPADVHPAREFQVLGIHPARTDAERVDSRLERHADGESARHDAGRHRELQHELDDVPRGDVRPELCLPGRMLRRRLRRRTAVLQRLPGEPHRQPQQRGARAICRSSFRKRPWSTRTISSTRSSTPADRRCGTARACCCRRASRGATASRNNAPPNIGFPEPERRREP